MVIAIAVFQEYVLLGGVLRINFIAPNEKGPILKTADASLFGK